VAYLYEVGSGKTYATITAALNAVYNDWGTNEFDAPVVVDIYSGTYNETIHPNTDLNPRFDAPLVIQAHSGESVTIDRTGIGADNMVVWTLYKCCVLDGLTFSNSGCDYRDVYQFCGLIKNCTFNTGVTYSYPWQGVYRTVLEDCTFVKTGSDPPQWFRDMCTTTFRRCKFDWSQKTGSFGRVHYSMAGGGGVTYESCHFIGNGTGTLVDSAHNSTTTHGDNLHVRNCSFYNCGSIMRDVSSRLCYSQAWFINCIFHTFTDDVFDFRYALNQTYANTPDLLHVEACCFYNCSGNFIVDASGSYSTIAAIRTAGYDKTGKCIDSDPKYVSTTSGSEDLNLQSDSPCINAGVGAGVLKDINGVTAPYPQEPAIGADFQHDVAPSVPSTPTISVADNGDHSSFTVTIDGDASVSHTVKYCGKGSYAWQTGGTRTGDGTVNVSSGPGTFWVYVYSTSGSYNSAPTEIVEVTVQPDQAEPLGPGQHRWRYYTYDESTGTWTLDGDYPAPVQELPLEDGRDAGMVVLQGADGGKIVTRAPERSRMGSTRMRWFREKSGADYAIYHKLNEWEKTGAGIKIETHVAGAEMMGFFRRVWRTWARTNEADGQEYEPHAVFEHFPVDGTGVGW